MVVQPGLCGGLVGNPEDRFSQNEAHIFIVKDCQNFFHMNVA